MYENFYALSASPFQLTPDARFFYESTVHRQAMAYLVYGLHHAEGFIIITGEVGAGKTILVDNLLSTIDQSNFVIAKIVTTQLAGDDLLHLVAAGFGIAKEGLAKGALLQRITDFVLAQQRNGRRVLLIVDEAQNLSFGALEELRMLSNIVGGSTMALQSFLLGQPQFRAMLGSPELEQLRQRVTAAYHLGPLNEGETRAYIEHRLGRADWKGDPQFTEDCFPVIYRHTRGVPRQINTLCSRLLLYGFLEQLHTLQAAMVEKTANKLRYEMAVVPLGPISEVSRIKPVGEGRGDARGAKQISALEENASGHRRVMKRALELRGVRRVFKQAGTELKVLNGVDLVLRPGEVVALVGPSGAGKSTLLHIAGLLERPDSGAVLIGREDCGDFSEEQRTLLRRSHIGFVYQFHHLLPEFSALENVMLPQMIAGIPRHRARGKAAELLDLIGIGARAGFRPGRLSGGERQRVAIVRALANDPEILLADEPTGNLDHATGETVMNTLLDLVRHTGLAVLIATHNLALGRRLDRIVALEDGRLKALD